ncbi:hypothetical protein NP493_2911g00007 [Ridgeia piscesae]|uniref:Uncharacterized protein n=1 Tax=Ridgeia piscesae TaxID=27915 RepID=A0AAD9INJ6_RIDPI|nr:hypothetical protein NP493_8994g00000 [Ridgeia piscesae]KAK2143603.1 hypothetical protein NP493_4468g00002 [Ridgeia piscesae]KAK2149693.1 hypothetical protein NP493_2911g00007 [Ridgeia piscesae]
MLIEWTVVTVPLHSDHCSSDNWQVKFSNCSVKSSDVTCG